MRSRLLWALAEVLEDLSIRLEMLSMRVRNKSTK
jgi:hypothetical protein